MASRTTAQAGPWSAESTWTGGAKPADGDSATVNHAVTFDVDLITASIALAGLVINNTLTVSTSPGVYSILMSGVSGQNITFGTSGQLLAGSSTEPLPVATTFTIDLNGASRILPGTGSVHLYCTQPTYSGVRVTEATQGATQLTITEYIDCATGSRSSTGDLTADSLWVDGESTLSVANVNRGRDHEVHILQNHTASTLTLAAPLAASKISGTFVWLTRRNIRIIGGTATNGCVYMGSSCTYICEMAAGATGFGYTSLSRCIVGGVIHGGGSGMDSGEGNTVTAVVSGMSGRAFSGAGRGSLLTPAVYATGAASGIATTATNSSNIQAHIFGCTNGVQYLNDSELNDAEIDGCTTAINVCSCTLRNCRIGEVSGNTTDINVSTTGTIVGYGTTLGQTVQVGGIFPDITGRTQVVLWGLDGSPGSLKAWMGGGRVVSDVNEQPVVGMELPTIRLFFESSTLPTFLDYHILAESRRFRAFAWIKYASGTSTMSEPVSVQVVDPGRAWGSPSSVLSTVASDPSVTGWQQVHLDYYSATQRPLILRTRGINSSGSAWVALRVVPDGFPRRPH